jgi:hypothetical protein
VTSRTDPPTLFIVGAPRSGTTLLYRCLALHPDAGWISNYHSRLPRFWPVAALNRATRHTPDWRYAAWFGPAGDAAYRYGSPRARWERAYPQPVEGEAVFAACGIPAVWRGEPVTARQRRLAPLLARTLRAGGGEVLVSKRIGHNRRIPLLDSLLPGSRFVEVVRDGRDVVDSLLAVDWWPQAELWWWGLGATPADWVAAGRAPEEAAAEHWLAETSALREGMRGIPKDRVLRIRYEDLVASPGPTVAVVAGFAGLDPGAGTWQEALAAIDFRSRKHTPSGDEPTPGRRAALALLAPRLREEGYPL